MEKSRRAVASSTADWNGTALNAITISIGLAVYPAHSATPEMLIEPADDVLCDAKRCGRNRVAISGGIRLVDSHDGPESQ